MIPSPVASVGSYLPSGASADIKVQDRTAVEFEGVLGGVVNLFGGKAAREGITSTVAVKGDRRVARSRPLVRGRP
jgi:hypothetical protein